MAESVLMKKGLESLFSPEKKFEDEAGFGRKILAVAWAVEIMAALAGLTIAWGTAYDAYLKIDEPTQGHIISALIGAIPFVIIAIIEPTKIPLAGGFYKTRILSWKLLILAALLGLTIVTFETIFNGLERNLTNVTAQIVNSEREIQSGNDRIAELNRELRTLKEKDISIETKDIREQIEGLQNEYDKDTVQIYNKSESKIESLLSQKRGIKNDSVEISKQRASNFQQTNLDKQIAKTAARLLDLEQKKQQEIKRRLDEKNRNSNEKLDRKTRRISELKRDSQSANQKLSEYRGEIQSKQDATTEKIKEITLDYNSENELAVNNHNESLEKFGFFEVTQKESQIKSFEESRKVRANQKDQQINRIRTQEQVIVKGLSKEIEKLNDRREEIEKQISRINQEHTEENNNNIDIQNSVDNKYKDEISQIRNKINELEKERSNITRALDGRSSDDLKKLDEKVKIINDQIETENERTDERIKKHTERFIEAKIALEDDRKKRISTINQQKEKISAIEKKIEEGNKQINLAKNEKRKASFDNQVYRLAALVFGKADVADVTRDEIKIISAVWFGSIAFIVSTIGTVLALISYILRDPEAFVERKPFTLSRRINRICYLIFGRINVVLLSGIRLLGALIRLVLSFAEVFRGMIGVPLQRSVRKTMLSIRRKANKPKIVTVEKVVEKIIENVKEIEIPVEKIIIKEVEVPVEVVVEKVQIKEVPVEIIRKEIIYVPLYSTEAGVIDVSTVLSGSRPRLNEEAVDEVSYKEGTYQNARNTVQGNNGEALGASPGIEENIGTETNPSTQQVNASTTVTPSSSSDHDDGQSTQNNADTGPDQDTPIIEPDNSDAETPPENILNNSSDSR